MFSPMECDVATYVASMHTAGVPLDTIDLRCSCLLMTLELFGMSLTSSATVRRIRTALRRIQPPVPRYHEFFDIALVFRVLASWGPSTHLALKQLRARAITLLRMDSFARSADLSGLWRSQCEFVAGGARLRFFKPKELRVHVGTRDLFSSWVHIGCVPELPDICAVCNLREYLQRTEALASGAREFPFFLPLRRPFSRLHSDTFSNVVQLVLTAAGVDPRFLPHAVRGSALTAALEAGCPIAMGRRQGRWAEASESFARHYDRAVCLNPPPWVVSSPQQIARLLRLEFLAVP